MKTWVTNKKFIIPALLFASLLTTETAPKGGPPGQVVKGANKNDGIQRISRLVKLLSSKNTQSANRAFFKLLEIKPEQARYLLIFLYIETYYAGNAHLLNYSIPPGFTETPMPVYTGDLILLICERVLLNRKYDLYYPVLQWEGHTREEILQKATEEYLKIYSTIIEQSVGPNDETTFKESPLIKSGIQWSDNPFKQARLP